MQPRSWLKAVGPRNPFSCQSDTLPVNLVLMVKLIALGLLLKGYLFDLSDHFLPYWPIFDYLGPFHVFNDVSQVAFLAGVGGILFSRSIRFGSVILGLVMLITVVSSRVAYSNVKFFCGCILLLTGLADSRNPAVLLRYQMAIVYSGAWINKVFDPDWRSGQYFEHWMSAIIKREFYVQAASLFPPMLLSRVMCWSTIVTEMFLSAGFLLRPLRQLSVLVGVYFHSMAFLLAWYDFRMFTIAILSSYLILVRWPEKLGVSIDPGNRLHRWIKTVFARMDFDRRIDWKPRPGGFMVEIFEKNYSGFQAFKRLILYSPVSYFGYVLILGLPNEPFLWFKLKAVQLVLIFFFPYWEMMEALKVRPHWRKRLPEKAGKKA